jgi:hypothetical protein
LFPYIRAEVINPTDKTATVFMKLLRQLICRSRPLTKRGARIDSNWTIGRIGDASLPGICDSVLNQAIQPA